MPTFKTELSDVIYNAARQSFEANVVIHDPSGKTTYACAIAAPVSLPFEDAAAWLTEQALLRHSGPSGLHMRLARGPAPDRAADHTQTQKPKGVFLDTLRKVAARKVATDSYLRRGLPVGQYGFFRGRAA